MNLEECKSRGTSLRCELQELQDHSDTSENLQYLYIEELIVPVTYHWSSEQGVKVCVFILTPSPHVRDAGSQTVWLLLMKMFIKNLMILLRNICDTFSDSVANFMVAAVFALFLWDVRGCVSRWCHRGTLLLPVPVQ